MITTICLNPALDRTVTVDALTTGHVNRVRTTRTDVGGKGINVALVCSRLGLEAQVVGCAGIDGFSKIRSALLNENVGCHFHTVEGAVRLNTKVVSLSGGVTELNEPGPRLSAEDLDVFFDMTIDAARNSEYVVLTGSLPPGCPDDTYYNLIKFLSPLPCILDASGAALTEGIKARPFLIKPNHHELAAAIGQELHTLEEIRCAAMRFVNRGVRHVVVSLGKDGVLYAGEEGCFHAPEIPVEVRSTVGAGDSLVGGLVYGLIKYGNMRDALRTGAAAGTASVMTDGTQLIIPRDFERILPQVRLQDL